MSLALANKTILVTGVSQGVGTAYLYTLSPIEFQTVNEWVNPYRANTVVPMALTRALLPLLQQSADASIVFVSISQRLLGWICGFQNRLELFGYGIGS